MPTTIMPVYDVDGEHVDGASLRCPICRSKQVDVDPAPMPTEPNRVLLVCVECETARFAHATLGLVAPVVRGGGG